MNFKNNWIRKQNGDSECDSFGGPTIMTTLVRNVVSVAFVIGTIVLLLNGNTEGWGWCIFGALACHSSN